MSREGGHRLVAKPLVRRWVVPQLVGVAERLEGPLAT